MGNTALFLALTTVVSGCIGGFATEAELRAMVERNKDKDAEGSVGGSDVAGKDAPRRIGETRVGSDAGETADSVEPTPEVAETTEVVEAPDVVEPDIVEQAPEVTEDAGVEPAAEVAEGDTVDSAEPTEPDTAEPVPEVVDADADADEPEIPDVKEIEVAEVAEEVTVAAPDADAVEADETAEPDIVEPDTAEPEPEVVETTEVVDTAEVVAPDISPDVPPDPCLVKNCDDGNTCTEDLCALKAGAAMCINLPQSATACSDNNACTLGDQCSAGTCKAGVPKVCEDGNVCTTDNCSQSTGACSFTPVGPYLEDGFEYTSLEESKQKGWVFSVTNPIKQEWSIAKAKEKLAQDGGKSGLGVQNAVLNSTVTATIILPPLPVAGAKLKLNMSFWHQSDNSSQGYKLGWRVLDASGKEVASDALSAPPSGSGLYSDSSIPGTAVKLVLFLTGGYNMATSQMSVFDALLIGHPACMK